MDPQIVEDPVFKHRLKFERGTDEQGREAVIVEMWVDPGGGVTPHIHPAMEERFTVLDGRAEFLAGRTWVGADPGETVVVPAGMRHAYRNRGDVVAHVRCVAAPADPGLEDFLTRAAAMGRAGKLTRHGIPKGLGALLEAAVMLQRNREMVTILFPPLPPPWIQRLLVPPLARLGERRGYGAAPAPHAAMR
ncbi:MAG TPA: cupin domain-containing protein [Conexibacter sp.]|nr:cupin domain-containing protein [Conexibacter sp.]